MAPSKRSTDQLSSLESDDDWFDGFGAESAPNKAVSHVTWYTEDEDEDEEADAGKWLMAAGFFGLLLLVAGAVLFLQIPSGGDEEAAPLPRADVEQRERLRPTLTAGLIHFAEYDDGKVYLQGRVPSRVVADEIARKAAALVGTENVIDEYLIDPDAPTTENAPLIVRNPVLFETNTAVVAPEYQPLILLAVNALSQKPDVVVTATGHTDDTGTPASNAVLSEQRIKAIVDGIGAAGGDTARVEGEAKGETDPVADNSTVEGRKLNRRAEMIITGLID